MVMLHGCGQDAQALAASTRMNLIAARERFLVLYPEQDRLSNSHGCWNWFQTLTGKAQKEADEVLAAIDTVCRTQAADPARVALAGFSAGAGMAAFIATRNPQCFQAVAMHSGIGPGLAHSTASALNAMRGIWHSMALAALAGGEQLPPLLVLQGTADTVVAPANGAKAAQLWAEFAGAVPSLPQTVQRGARYPLTTTHFCKQHERVATLCEIDGLGHAWSGGSASQAYSDPKGPDASRLIWSFAAKQFAKSAALRASRLPPESTVFRTARRA
jgi:poly(hydroxyalkanoate) depolymerase family esterase